MLKLRKKSNNLKNPEEQIEYHSTSQQIPGFQTKGIWLLFGKTASRIQNEKKIKKESSLKEPKSASKDEPQANWNW